MIVLCVGPDRLGDDLAKRVAYSLGVDPDLILANAAPGHDHLVVGSSPAGTFAVPTDASGAADLLRQFASSGSLDPLDLMPPPATVLALMATH